MGCGPNFGFPCPECNGMDEDCDACEGTGTITPERLEELNKEEKVELPDENTTE